VPCNKIHVFLMDRIKAGIRDAGGIPMEFPVHPIQETGKRPTAALDRNLQYLSLVEVLHGYPIDGVVLTTGCDKTTPAMLMGAATVDLPAIALNGGPMLDGWYKGKRAGSGTTIWEGRRMMARGEIGYEEFMELACASSPSLGHCNTMGTASTMNALAEALGMTLPGAAAIPAPFRERMEMAYLTGRRIVGMVEEDLKPSDILTRAAFLNAIKVNTAIGGSTNAPPHLQAIARHIWGGAARDGLADPRPRPAASGEPAAGGRIPRRKLLPRGRGARGDGRASGRRAARRHGDDRHGPAHGRGHRGARSLDRDVIRPFDDPLRTEAGFLVLSGNLFDSALMKTSVISEDFRARFLKDDICEGRAVVFEGPEDYHARINDPALEIGEDTFLFIRNVGCVGYPGSAEVVNMQPPDALIRAGVNHLPTVGDGRQSGTSESPSILNASPEAAVGGGLALLQTGDRVRLDLKAARLDALVDAAEWAARRAAWVPPELHHQTPWQELYRTHVGQLGRWRVPGAGDGLPADREGPAAR
jgi:dihydroxyacid dehydratase/phosphogluconate dehydratase